jgi:hypothetical protein
LGVTYELVLLAADVGHVHVVGGGAQLFKLLGGEDVDGDQMDLGVAVLASLRGGHFDDLAGTVLNDNEAVLPQSRALHGEGLRGTGIGALEGVLMLYTIWSVRAGRCVYAKNGGLDAWPGAFVDGDRLRWGKMHMRGLVLVNVPARRPPW